MKFHEYKTLWEEMCTGFPRHVTEEKFYSVAMSGGVRAGNGLVLAEGIWKQLRRPYYQVYPAIIRALLNLRLDIQTSLIHTAGQCRGSSCGKAAWCIGRCWRGFRPGLQASNKGKGESEHAHDLGVPGSNGGGRLVGQ